MNAYKFLDVVKAKTTDELKKAITEIKQPLKILFLYHDGVDHIAWLNLSMPLKKPVQNKDEIKKQIGEFYGR